MTKWERLRTLGLFIAVLVGTWGVTNLTYRMGQASVPKFQTKIGDAEAIQVEIKSLSRLLREQGEESERLRSLIASLPDPEVRYVVQERVVLQGEQVQVQEIPDQHTFLLNSKIPVAQILKQEQGYLLESYDLSFSTDVVVGSKSAVGSVRVQSSGLPGQTFEVPSTITVSQAPPTFLAPHLGLGGTIGFPGLDPAVSVYMPLLHPTPDVDLLIPRISVSPTHLYGGVDAMGWNIGGPAPLLQDLWVYGGVSIQEQLEVSGSLTLGSKL